MLFRSFSSTKLSDGQKKRLALLVTFLENRAIFVFDEWASDQDPLFKEIFYTQLLPDLKARNKTALVITHDDRYFHLADRIIKLDYGRIETRHVDGHAPYPELLDGAGVRAGASTEKPVLSRAS